MRITIKVSRNSSNSVVYHYTYYNHKAFWTSGRSSIPQSPSAFLAELFEEISDNNHWLDRLRWGWLFSWICHHQRTKTSSCFWCNLVSHWFQSYVALVLQFWNLLPLFLQFSENFSFLDNLRDFFIIFWSRLSVKAQNFSCFSVRG